MVSEPKTHHLITWSSALCNRCLETCICLIIFAVVQRQNMQSLKVLYSVMTDPTQSYLLTCLPAVSKKKYVSMPKQATSSHTMAASIKPRPGTKPNSFRTPSPETRRGGKTESLRGEVKMKSTGAWWNSLTCSRTVLGPTIASQNALKEQGTTLVTMAQSKQHKTQARSCSTTAV